MAVAGATTTGDGRSGLGDATQDLNDQITVAVLTAAVLAYGSAMAASDFARAGVYLTFFQAFWNDYSYRAKRYGAGHGYSAAVLAVAPDRLAVDGAWGQQTHDTVSLVLVLYFGADPARAAVVSTPSTAAGVGLWFSTKVAGLEPPASSLWGMWNTTKLAPMANMLDVVASWASTYIAGGTPTPATPTPTTPTPTTPVPGGLPTVRRPTAIQTDSVITAGTGKTPTWVWVGGGAILVGAVVGVGYYLVKKRPDLFRSRAKKRR